VDKEARKTSDHSHVFGAEWATGRDKVPAGWWHARSSPGEMGQRRGGEVKSFLRWNKASGSTRQLVLRILRNECNLGTRRQRRRRRLQRARAEASQGAALETLSKHWSISQPASLAERGVR
jgi:hypothetical protein